LSELMTIVNYNLSCCNRSISFNNWRLRGNGDDIDGDICQVQCFILCTRSYSSWPMSLRLALRIHIQSEQFRRTYHIPKFRSLEPAD